MVLERPSADEISQTAERLRAQAAELRRVLDELRAELVNLSQTGHGWRSAASDELLARVTSSQGDLTSALSAISAYLESVSSAYREAEEEVASIFKS